MDSSRNHLNSLRDVRLNSIRLKAINGDLIKINWILNMELKPSQIYYSQDSINNVFDQRCRHSYQPIGETLDAICEDRCSIHSVPTISVMQINGRWITADNRRLWVFRQLERLGKCTTVPVYTTYHIPAGKMTAFNGGDSVRVRGSPGGRWHLKPKPLINQQYTPYSRPSSSTSYTVRPEPPPVAYNYPAPKSDYSRREISHDYEERHTMNTHYRPVQQENTWKNMCTIL
ncbi:hypothetical protein MAR_003310 [Mya arenaria]|uniref:Uncharacterized protein n=1 Tax=Mya arenaria TaxID=6604 RepID=A0ABY7G8R5_MYAAR|nr:hypothetical protein MAR_003310 [Mya arenaria]